MTGQVLDPFGPTVRDGFIRLVAGNRVRSEHAGEPIESVTRAQLAEATPMWRGYDIEVALLGYGGDAFTIEQRQSWDEQRERLRAQIVQTRSLLHRHSRLIKDPVLTETLAGRLAAIEGFDIDGVGLPVPDDADFAAVEAVLRERIDTVGQQLSAQHIEVDPRVLLRSLTDTYTSTTRTEPAYNGYNWTSTTRRRLVTAAATLDPEIELVTRLFARDIPGQTAAAQLLTRIYWQRETLRQAVADAVAAVANPSVQPTKSFSAQPTGDSPVTVIGRLHLESLAELINVSHAVAAHEYARRAQSSQSTPGAPARDVGLGPLIFWGKRLIGWISDNIDTSRFNERDGYIGQTYD
ncbi:hypothetical protein [Nocardia mangyaensis]|uniref:hypothetical protein n=1 Tax=Nocardia mangyaensis TaxID=2213200 RepID=UPI00267538CF|nr:hypothetical protein [Nocardia mangyaensis]MDO3647795.1 hypothetical protein [Nocardia mangyaensis]